MSLGENRSVSLVGEIGPFLGSEFERLWGLNGNVSGEGELVCLGGVLERLWGNPQCTPPNQTCLYRGGNAPASRWSKDNMAEHHRHLDAVVVAPLGRWRFQTVETEPQRRLIPVQVSASRAWSLPCVVGAAVGVPLEYVLIVVTCQYAGVLL